MTTASQFADVLLLRGIPVLYTYIIPENLLQDIKIGSPVIIPIGKAQAEGIIMAITSQSKTDPAKLKPISELNSKRPTIPKDLINLIRWFTDYYQTTPYKAFQTIVGKQKVRTLPSCEENPAPTTPPYTLTQEQQDAISNIANSTLTEHLLCGITGSGKTEVYLQLAQKTLEEGKQVILLIPEIALTPQTTERIKTRFGDNIAILHSHLTPKQKEIEWTKIVTNSVQIAIGPRSAIFAPFNNIGLIIIDEEHDNSYKQDQNPRYLTHTIALKRAQDHQAKLIYGSATPQLETLYKTTQNTCQLHTLKNRIHNQKLPEVTLIDLTQNPTLTSPLSHPLVAAIKTTLEKKEKALILINRRGFAPTIICQKCGKRHTCPKCDLSYTYHKDRTFRCHRCAIKTPITHTCNHCKKRALTFAGTGIQKVEMELKNAFPNHTIIRLDKDTAKSAKTLEETLDTFKTSGDILIGTQLIAKGHDIPDITLVGVLGIDTLLNLPDFRSPERAFQLATQVAGRAGRGLKKGHVYIQTHNAEHYALYHAKTHNLDAFTKEEIDYRETLNYPPFTNLINIIISSKIPHAAQSTAQSIGQNIHEHLSDLCTQIIGPKIAPFEKINDYYRWNILIKHDISQAEPLKKALIPWIDHPRNVRVIIDFDPKSIL